MNKNTLDASDKTYQKDSPETNDEWDDLDEGDDIDDDDLDEDDLDEDDLDFDLDDNDDETEDMDDDLTAKDDAKDNKVENLAAVTGNVADSAASIAPDKVASKNIATVTDDKEVYNAADMSGNNDLVTFKLDCEVGNISLNLKEVLQLRPGSVLDIAQLPPVVNLKLSGKDIARGILVDINGRLGVKIIAKL